MKIYWTFIIKNHYKNVMKNKDKCILYLLSLIPLTNLLIYKINHFSNSILSLNLTLFFKIRDLSTI